jgi:FkbM family methyltransferase
MFVKRKLRQLGNKFGFKLIDALNPGELFIEMMKYHHLDLPNIDVKKNFLIWCLKNLHKTKAQACQDLLVLFLSKEKRNGYFVEFGATNGITLSNTYLLESAYAWNGILAEPAIKWHRNLKDNRHCIIDTRCVFSTSGLELPFLETSIGELSTISQFASIDGHDRNDHESYKVISISLEDLLREHNAPNIIDYLSIDTEGSEYEILNSFDFSSYQFNIISVEHNYTAARQAIYKLLTKQGYQRIFEDFSMWDDWYIHESFIKDFASEYTNN